MNCRGNSPWSPAPEPMAPGSRTRRHPCTSKPACESLPSPALLRPHDSWELFRQHVFKLDVVTGAVVRMHVLIQWAWASAFPMGAAGAPARDPSLNREAALLFIISITAGRDCGVAGRPLRREGRTSQSPWARSSYTARASFGEKGPALLVGSCVLTPSAVNGGTVSLDLALECEERSTSRWQRGGNPLGM